MDISNINVNGTTHNIVDDEAMRYVSSPTANNILLTNASGQAIDGGTSLSAISSAISAKQNTVLSGTTEPTSDIGVNGDIYILYTE